jgi:hypothetical protein
MLELGLMLISWAACWYVSCVRACSSVRIALWYAASTQYAGGASSGTRRHILADALVTVCVCVAACTCWVHFCRSVWKQSARPAGRFNSAAYLYCARLDCIKEYILALCKCFSSAERQILSTRFQPTKVCQRIDYGVIKHHALSLLTWPQV